MDKKTAYLEELISGGDVFKNAEWSGGDTSLPHVNWEPKKSNGVHKKHAVARKKGMETTAVRCTMCKEKGFQIKEISFRS